MKIIHFIFIIILFTSCKSQTEFQKVMKEMQKEKSFFDPVELGSGGSKGNFIIKTRFSECGEWGGHFEKIKVYAKHKSKKFYLDYIQTEVDCNLEESSSIYSQDTIVTKTIELNRSKEKAILNYLEALVKSKVTSRFPGHSGNYFEVEKSDSTFTIKSYDSRKSSMENYLKLLRKLNLD
jgi:hypothetical protein